MAGVAMPGQGATHLTAGEKQHGKLLDLSAMPWDFSRTSMTEVCRGEAINHSGSTIS